MTSILKFIVAHMGFLWRDGRYHVVGSVVSGEFSGALLIVEGPRLRLRFISDRGQLFLDLQRLESDPSKEAQWHSAYRVRRLMTGERRESAVLDGSDATFIDQHHAQIEDLFSSENWPETEERLKSLGKIITKEIFG